MRRIHHARPSLCLAAAALAAIGGDAAAAPLPVYQLVDDCDQETDDCGAQSKNTGPGFEQAKGDWFTGPSGNPWVGYVVMSSKGIANRAEGPYQCRYYAWEIDPVQGPQMRVAGRFLTQNRGNRPCNHPDLQFIGGTDMLFCFGTNDDNDNNVQTYGQIIDATTGIAKAERTQLTDNNGNDGAGTCQVMKTGASIEALELPTAYPKRFVLCHNDNGDNADCVVGDVQAGGAVARVAQIDDVIDPANIPRPHMVQVTTDGKFAITAARGDQRPPEDGAYVRVIDVANPTAGADADGLLTDQMVLMASRPDENLYANSPELHAPGPTPGTFWAMNITSRSNNRDSKGASTAYAHVVRFNQALQLEIVTTLASAGEYQAHGAMCTSTYGADGVQAGIIAEASITNSGSALITPLLYGEVTAMAKGRRVAATPWTSDSGELANIYGNNPNTQGRDFVDCIGSVPNPGYGRDDGFQNETKSFVVMPSYGKMKSTDYKNSFFLSFLPGHTPGKDPTPVDPTDPEPGDGGEDDGGDGDPAAPPPAPGCATGHSTDTAAALLAALAIALIATRRRRADKE